MDEERNGTPILTMLLRAFATTFSWSILAMCITGMLIARLFPGAGHMPTFFDFDGAGIPFTGIIQMAVFSLIMASFATLIFCERFFAKMRFLWRAVFLCLATLVTCSVFVVLFGWFPVHSPRAWLTFVLATVLCFSLSFALVRLKHKLEGKRYDRLLANYKARRN